MSKSKPSNPKLVNISIDYLQEDEIEPIVDIIRRNVSSDKEAGSVISSIHRRIDNLKATYFVEGCCYLVAKDQSVNSRLVGGAGVGPLQGLPVTEGIGEVRDVVVESDFRGRGIGARLLKRCLAEARRLGYKRLYLEMTPQMEQAKKLFYRFGFRPVEQKDAQQCAEGEITSYFLLEKF